MIFFNERDVLLDKYIYFIGTHIIMNKNHKNISVYFSDDEWKFINQEINKLVDLENKEMPNGRTLTLSPSNFIKWKTLGSKEKAKYGLA